MNKMRFRLAVVIVSVFIVNSVAFSWGKVNHGNITRAAFDLLSKREQAMFGSAADSLINHYCLNPDNHRWAVRNKVQDMIAFYDPYVNLPLLQNQKQWHKNDDENSEVCFYITTKLMHHAIENLQANRPLEAAKYLGTLAHFIEDNACPVHVLPDLTIAQLLPSPNYPKPMDIHHAVEGPTFPVDISDYKPQLLGKNLVEASEAIYPRFKDIRINARAQLVPLIQAMYADDEKETGKYRSAAAEPAAKLYADILHTVCSIAQKDK